MSAKGLAVVLFCLFILSVISTIIFVEDCHASSNTVYVDDGNTAGPWDGTQTNPYQHIQDAINASATDIYVYDGVYENITITGGITLTGENKETTIIDAGGTGPVIYATGVNITITGFTIRNSGSNGMAGIQLNYATNCSIHSNIVENNGAHGITMAHSDGNTIDDNIIKSNVGKGIGLSVSDNNIVSNNIIQNNINGIRLDASSSGNTFTGNTVKENHYGIDILDSSNNNILSHNILVDNDQNAKDVCTNSWDNGYSSGGNYWDDYTGVDNFNGPSQDIHGSDSIGDTPYNIPGGDNKDMYVLGYFEKSSGPSSNSAPTADAGGPYTGHVNQSISFDGTDSSDPDGDPLTYTWDFGDGSTATVVSPTHSYSSVGIYNVLLTVSDGTLTNTDTTAANISESSMEKYPPVADAGGPYSGNVDDIIFFNGSESSDADGTIISYAWDFGDENVGVGKYVNHSYDVASTYTVTLTVTDNSSLTHPATTTATIAASSSQQNQPPVAHIDGPYSCDVNQLIQFDASNSSDEDGDIASYFWDFGDGANVTEINATTTHRYTKEETYTIILTVTDNDGVADSTSTIITVKSSWNFGENISDFTHLTVIVALVFVLLWRRYKQ